MLRIAMPADQPHRISLATATAIVVACMVGTGVFTSLGFQIGGMPSGFPILLLWAVGGVVALCGAFSYAELTAMMPRSGGEYHLVGRAYHPLVGFLAGWVSITAGFSAPIAITAMAFGKYMNDLWPGIDARFAGFGVVALLTMLQLGGVRFIAKFHFGLTVMRVLLIVAFVAGAIFLGTHPLSWNVLAPKSGDMKHVLSSPFANSLFYVMYAYSGWNGAVYVAGEMKNPQRNLPLALLFGTLGVMALYLALNAVFLAGGDWNAMRNQEDVGLIAARGIFSDRGSTWMGALIAFGLLSTVNAMLWTGASTLRVIGRDMRALCWLDSSDRRGEPVGAVLFMTNLVLLLLGTGSFQSLLDYTQALLQLSASLCVFAVIWLRIRKPDAPRPFKVPFYPLPPLIFLGVSLWMFWVMVDQKPAETLWGAVTLLIGVLLYLCSPKDKAGEITAPAADI
jgi:basic amino acid/polyamine antiporter, APA family